MTRYLRIPNAEIARRWLDTSQTRAQIAQDLGICTRQLTIRAKALGLAVRGLKTSKPIITDTEEFTFLWGANVSVHEIGGYFGVSFSAVYRTARRLGLAMRGQGKREFTPLVRVLMEREAAKDRARWREADMIDHFKNRHV